MYKSHHRGHSMYFDRVAHEWRYTDDDTLVKNNWEKRPCGKCNEYITADGHDPCIANLPGVRNACCGHGEDSSAYVQFDDGRYASGEKAISVFKELQDNSTSTKETK